MYVIIMSRMRFRVKLHYIVAWITMNFLPKQAQYLKFKGINVIWTYNRLAHKRTLNYLAKHASLS